MPAPIVKAEPLTLGFAPDDEPMKPGIVTDCINVMPTANGLSVAPGWTQNPGISANGGAPIVDIFSAQDTSGYLTYVLAQKLGLTAWTSNLWLNISTSFTPVAANAAGDWSFCQFGSKIVAARREALLMQGSGGPFVDVAGSPMASIVCASQDFVLAFNTRANVSVGPGGDVWACSAFQDPTSWAPSLSTQATTGRIVAGGGEITAALALGPQVIAYKTFSAFAGTYVGSPVVWQWDRIPGRLGCAGMRAVCDIGGAHFVVGPDAFWLYDGVRAQQIGAGSVSDWFRAACKTPSKTVCVYDRATATVQIWFDVGDGVYGPTLGRCLTYNTLTGGWGLMAVNDVTAVGRLQAPVHPASYASAEKQAIATGSIAVTGIKYADPAVLPAPSPYIVTRAIGDDTQSSRILDVRLAYGSSPTAIASGAPPDRITLTGYTGRTSAAITRVVQSGVPEADGRFSVRQSDRWHKFRLNISAPAAQMPEVHALTVSGIPAGTR